MKYIILIIVIFTFSGCNIFRSDLKDGDVEFDKNVKVISIDRDSVSVQFNNKISIYKIGDRFCVMDEKGNGFIYIIRNIHYDISMINIEFKNIDKNSDWIGDVNNSNYHGFSYRLKGN